MEGFCRRIIFHLDRPEHPVVGIGPLSKILAVKNYPSERILFLFRDVEFTSSLSGWFILVNQPDRKLLNRISVHCVHPNVLGFRKMTGIHLPICQSYVYQVL